MPRNIASGQRISESKYLESKILRQNMTWAERLLWARLRRNRAEGRHFRRQQIIAGFIVDFYCHKAGLIVEVDGAVHEKNKEKDFQRGTILEEMGFRILRFSNREVIEDIEMVLEKILAFCDSDLTPPPL
jgi:very-short-patch-repair endonuclease